MPQLLKPTLHLGLTAGSTQVRVTATVNVSFDAVEEKFISLLGGKFKLRCKIWGEDSGFNGEDDYLFSIASKTITADGTYTFTRTVDRSALDEDWGDDEICARFSCSSTTLGLPFKAFPVKSPSISGSF